MQGQKHEYLKMVFDYFEHGKVDASLTKYTKNFIMEFLEAIVQVAATPASDHLFKMHTHDDRI